MAMPQDLNPPSKTYCLYYRDDAGSSHPVASIHLLDGSVELLYIAGTKYEFPGVRNTHAPIIISDVSNLFLKRFPPGLRPEGVADLENSFESFVKEYRGKVITDRFEIGPGAVGC